MGDDQGCKIYNVNYGFLKWQNIVIMSLKSVQNWLDSQKCDWHAFFGGEILQNSDDHRMHQKHETFLLKLKELEK